MDKSDKSAFINYTNFLRETQTSCLTPTAGNLLKHPVFHDYINNISSFTLSPSVFDNVPLQLPPSTTIPTTTSTISSLCSSSLSSAYQTTEQGQNRNTNNHYNNENVYSSNSNNNINNDNDENSMFSQKFLACSSTVKSITLLSPPSNFILGESSRTNIQSSVLLTPDTISQICPADIDENSLEQSKLQEQFDRLVGPQLQTEINRFFQRNALIAPSPDLTNFTPRLRVKSPAFNSRIVSPYETPRRIVNVSSGMNTPSTSKQPTQVADVAVQTECHLPNDFDLQGLLTALAEGRIAVKTSLTNESLQNAKQEFCQHQTPPPLSQSSIFSSSPLCNCEYFDEAIVEREEAHDPIYLYLCLSCRQQSAIKNPIKRSIFIETPGLESIRSSSDNDSFMQTDEDNNNKTVKSFKGQQQQQGPTTINLDDSAELENDPEFLKFVNVHKNIVSDPATSANKDDFAAMAASTYDLKFGHGMSPFGAAGGASSSCNFFSNFATKNPCNNEKHNEMMPFLPFSPIQSCSNDADDDTDYFDNHRMEQSARFFKGDAEIPDTDDEFEHHNPHHQASFGRRSFERSLMGVLSPNLSPIISPSKMHHHSRSTSSQQTPILSLSNNRDSEILLTSSSTRQNSSDEKSSFSKTSLRKKPGFIRCSTMQTGLSDIPLLKINSKRSMGDRSPILNMDLEIVNVENELQLQERQQQPEIWDDAKPLNYNHLTKGIMAFDDSCLTTDNKCSLLNHSKLKRRRVALPFLERRNSRQGSLSNLSIYSDDSSSLRSDSECSSLNVSYAVQKSTGIGQNGNDTFLFMEKINLEEKNQSGDKMTPEAVLMQSSLLDDTLLVDDVEEDD